MAFSKVAATGSDASVEMPTAKRGGVHFHRRDASWLDGGAAVWGCPGVGWSNRYVPSGLCLISDRFKSRSSLAITHENSSRDLDSSDGR